MSQIQYKFNKNDEYYTPAYAVKPLLKYLLPHSNIWCPFDTEESQFVQVLSKAGHNVIYAHISIGLDFFENKPPFGTDYIISNPPYSLKTEVFRRLYNLGKPFAMLINFQGIFDNKVCFDLFEANGCEMMRLSPRVSYIRPNCTLALSRFKVAICVTTCYHLNLYLRELVRRMMCLDDFT